MFEEKMTNCPHCRKPILNGGVFTSPAKFTIRCPWCQATLAITIMPKIIAEVIKLDHEDVRQAESGFGDGKLGSNKETVHASDAVPGFKVVGYMYPAEAPQK